MHKQFDTNPTMTIEVYKKRTKKLFCTIKITDEAFFEDLLDMLNSTCRYVKLTDNIIVDKTEIDYIILNN